MVGHDKPGYVTTAFFYAAAKYYGTLTPTAELTVKWRVSASLEANTL